MNIKVTGSYDKSNCTTTETSEPINFNKEYIAMRDTKSEYDIGCYYEFSDDSDFNCSTISTFRKINGCLTYKYMTSGCDSYKYIRPLTAKAGEIRKPKLLIGFVNVDADGVISIEPTREDADGHSYSTRIACIDLSQSNAGEGL